MSNPSPIVFTARFLATAKPRRSATGAPVYTEYRDAISPLRLAVQSSGYRSLIIRYRRPGDGKTAKYTLKNSMTLAASRHAAAAVMLQLEQGIDPSPRRSFTAAPHRGDDDSIEQAAASFLTLYVERKNRASTVRAAKRTFTRLILPAWCGRSIHDIRRRDVIALVEGIAIDRPYQANRTLALLSKFFRWLISRDQLAVSPVAGMERPHREQPRNDKLTDPQLRPLWRACEGDEPFGSALRLLIMLGARRNEVCQMRWSELDLDRGEWRLPAERVKNGRAFTLPLPRQARVILAAQPHIDGSDFVFTINGRNAIGGGWDRVKARLSKKAGIEEASWRLHDLRRTCASGMQRLGVRVEVIERALNHVSGVYRGVAGIYQVDPLADEVRIAFQKWADHVDHLVGGKPAKVVALRGRRR
jgi:integrase